LKTKDYLLAFVNGSINTNDASSSQFQFG